MKCWQFILVMVTAAVLAAGTAWAAQQPASPKPAAKSVVSQPAQTAQPAASQPADRPSRGEAHTMTAQGTVVSSTATSLVVATEVKGKQEDRTFTLTPETQRMGGELTPGAKVEVHYRMENKERIATKIEVASAAPAPAPARVQPAPKKK